MASETTGKRLSGGIDEDLQQYFTPDEWKGLSDYEKRRFTSIKTNYEKMKNAGLNPPCPPFMCAKPIKRRYSSDISVGSSGGDDDSFHASEDNTDSDKSEDWLAARKGKARKKPTKVPMSAKRGEKKIKIEPGTTPTVVTPTTSTGRGPGRPPTIMPSPVAANRDGPGQAPDILKRNVQRMVVTEEEEEVPNQEELKTCSTCGAESEGDCPIHYPLVFTDERISADKMATARSQLSLPIGLTICQSHIYDGGYGVWTDIYVNNAVTFGPYEGVIVQPDGEGYQNGYCWKVFADKGHHFIDGSDPAISNWLRFVNFATTPDEQNLVALCHGGKIYYKTCKPIPPGTELLVGLEKEFAYKLGFKP